MGEYLAFPFIVTMAITGLAILVVAFYKPSYKLNSVKPEAKSEAKPEVKPDVMYLDDGFGDCRDYTAKETTGVQIGTLGHRVWVCVDGVCILRIKSPIIHLDDMRKVLTDE